MTLGCTKGNTHLPGGKPVPGCWPSPDYTEGSAVPNMNFAGKGFRKDFRMRPTCPFDLAAKLHDLAYLLNELKFADRESYGNLKKNSHMAKADCIFRLMNRAVPPVGPSIYNPISRQIFKDFDEIVADDEYVNVLSHKHFVQELSDPERYLMIPYSDLRSKRPTKTEESLWKQPDQRQPITMPDYNVTVDDDFRPGFLGWLKLRYSDVLEQIIAY